MGKNVQPSESTSPDNKSEWPWFAVAFDRLSKRWLVEEWSSRSDANRRAYGLPLRQFTSVQVLDRCGLELWRQRQERKSDQNPLSGVQYGDLEV